MNQEDKRNPDNWSKEELDTVVRVFQWLLEQDRKQNPDLYKPQKEIVIDKEENEVKL